MIDPLLLVAARIVTYAGQHPLSNATGFFFERGARLFLVTSRHALIDVASGHRPDRLEISLHDDATNLASTINFSVLLYEYGSPVWQQASDASGDIDVAAIEIQRSAIPESIVYRAFTFEHIRSPPAVVEVGSALLVVGFPLGFHDALHCMPVVRHAVLASSFGLRFQGEGFFLTDARTHRGTSGSPVVQRMSSADCVAGDLTWMLLGIHTAQLDMRTRDRAQDDALGLNCTWYADVISKLTDASQ